MTDMQARSNADIVVTGCDIVTRDEQNTVLRDGAIAIDGGRIVWMGGAESSAELRKGVAYFRKAGVEHDVINAGDQPLAFVEIELLDHPL